MSTTDRNDLVYFYARTNSVSNELSNDDEDKEEIKVTLRRKQKRREFVLSSVISWYLLIGSGFTIGMFGNEFVIYDHSGTFTYVL